MRKNILLSILLVLFAWPVWAQENNEKLQINQCPKTTMQRDCMTCHVLAGKKFALKESSNDAWRVYPANTPMNVIDGVGYFHLSEIDARGIMTFFNYIKQHNIKRVVIEIHSPGGALFDAQKIVNIIKTYQASGGIVEMRLYGMAFSAGFYIFVSGSPRLVSPDADLMWHEIQSFEGFGAKITTPSDQEEKTRILRHLQNVRNAYIASCGKITKEEIDKKVSKREWWMTGTEAIECGFADGYVK